MAPGKSNRAVASLFNRSGLYRYTTEAAALAFVRDVARVAGHERAASFALDEQDTPGQRHTIAQGVDLVRRALQDRVI
jgi:hypothetical protein